MQYSNTNTYQDGIGITSLGIECLSVPGWHYVGGDQDVRCAG